MWNRCLNWSNWCAQQLALRRWLTRAAGCTWRICKVSHAYHKEGHVKGTLWSPVASEFVILHSLWGRPHLRMAGTAAQTRNTTRFPPFSGKDIDKVRWHCLMVDDFPVGHHRIWLILFNSVWDPKHCNSIIGVSFMHLSSSSQILPMLLLYIAIGLQYLPFRSQ